MFLVDRIILLAAILLILGVLSSKLSSRMGLPVLVVFLLVGMAAGSEGVGGIYFEDYSLSHQIGTIALVMILFDGGLRTRPASMRAVLAPSLTLATGGVLITALVTAAAAMWILDLPWMEALLLASIISSTDAAAVFAVLRSRSMNVRARVGATLEIESGSNDPMAVIMTIACIELLMGRIDAGPMLLWLFVKQLGLGALIGWTVGRLATFSLGHIRLDVAGLYSVLASALGLLAFGAAAVAGGSGFLAVYVAGVVMGSRRLPFQSGLFAFHDGMAWLAQIAMFVVLGLLSFPSRLAAVAGPALLVSAVLILVARPVAVALCLAPFRFTSREMAFIAAGGLKGAVPIVLAMYPLLAGLPDAKNLFDVVFFAVLVSAVTQGWTLPMFSRVFGVNEPPVSEPPAVLEISSLRDVDGDIVEYAVTSQSRAAGRRVRDLALPHGALVAMVVRDAELIPPRGSTSIQADDHVFVLTRRALRDVVDRIFGGAGQTPDAPAMEFPLRGSSRVADVESAYGIEIGRDGEQTLGDFMHERLGDAVKVGDSVRLGAVVLAVRDLADGRVVTVGFSIVHREHDQP